MSYVEKQSKYSIDGSYYSCIWKVLFWSTCWLIIPMIPFGILWYRWNREHMINSRAKQDVKIDELLIKYKKINNINVRLDKLKIDYELGKISFNEFEILKKRLSN